MRIALLVLALVAGCARGQALTAWTLDVEGGDTGIAIALPSNYLNRLPLRPLAYTLRASVTIDPVLRGQPLVLELDAYNGALIARIGDVVLEERGDPPVGWRRFAIPPALAERGTLDVTLELRRDLRTMLGVQTAPVLAAAHDGTGARIAAFNRYSAIVSLGVGALLCLFYGTMYVLGRRRLDLAIAVWAVANGLVMPLLVLGIPGELLGERVGLFVLYGGLLSLTSYFAFIHISFDLGPISRRWWYAFGILAVPATIVILAASLPGVVVCWALLNLNVIAANLYGLRRVWRAARRGDANHDARLFLVFNILTVALMFAEMTTIRTGHPPFGPIRLISIGITLQSIAQAIIVSRQHARQLRATAAANAELQRQVAERSRELGDALRALAVPAAPTTGPLADHLDRLRDREQARPLLAQIASQLAALHDKGQVHGDLKLAAILFDGDSVRIAGGHETHTAIAKGTPRAAATSADDILAFGRLAHELVTGEPPTSGDGELATLPSPLGVIVARCFDPDPTRRPTAAELVEALA